MFNLKNLILPVSLISCLYSFDGDLPLELKLDLDNFDQFCTMEYKEVFLINPSSNICEPFSLVDGCEINDFNSGKLPQSNWTVCDQPSFTDILSPEDIENAFKD